jgi:hypothetical protein
LQPSSAIGFSLESQQNAPHARAHPTIRFTKNIAVEIAVAGRRAFGDDLDVAGGHTRPIEIDASRRLLLPLHAREGPGKLREDVRAA